MNDTFMPDSIFSKQLLTCTDCKIHENQFSDKALVEINNNEYENEVCIEVYKVPSNN